MLDGIDNFLDVFRGGLAYYLLFSLPILIVVSPNPVLSSKEFAVYRLSQFDVNGVGYGCRTSALSLEAKSVFTWSTNRHCIVTNFQDLTMNIMEDIRQKAGGLIISLPYNISSLNHEEKEHITSIEDYMLSQSFNIPVYFARFSKDLEEIIMDLNFGWKHNEGKNRSNVFHSKVQKSESLHFFESVSANSYQVTVSGASHNNMKHSKLPIVQGELSPSKSTFKANENLSGESGIRVPTIIITANLKTFGIFSEYQFNADVTVLMSMMDLFNKFYNSRNYLPKYRLLFIISEQGSLLNFHSTKKWLDENTQFQNVEFVLCLDTIVESLNGNGDELYMHVSKPPKEGTSINNFYNVLKDTAHLYGVKVEGVHKKINLNDQQLRWEHERFSIKRLPAFTISALKSAKVNTRNSIFKDEDELVPQTQKMTKIIVESLAHYLYKVGPGEVFVGTNAVSRNLVKAYINMKSALHNNDLKHAFEKYLKNVKIVFEKPDIREPEFMFYEGQEAKLNVYRVKPAVFDLLLTIFISCYLTILYFTIQMFPKVYKISCMISKYPQNISQQNQPFLERSKKKE